ncbi:MAG: hypothetical protein M1378_09310 [Bacteroidetes bacterium]|nr:hypothetical protein [Bacteroidota bacterium]
MEQLADNIPILSTEMARAIEEAVEQKYLGEVQRLTDGLHEIRDALAMVPEPDGVEKLVIGKIAQTYATEAASALLSGLPAMPFANYLRQQSTGVTETLKTQEGK